MKRVKIFGRYVYKDDLVAYTFIIFVGLAILGIIGLIIGDVAFQIRHPCIRWGEPRTCEMTQLHCVVYNNDGTCSAWMPVTTEYDCTPCIERDMSNAE